LRKPLSLAHKVKIVGRRIDLTRTDVAETFKRVRRELATEVKHKEPKITQIRKRA